MGSRREFFRTLGLGAVGIPAAVVAATQKEEPEGLRVVAAHQPNTIQFQVGLGGAYIFRDTEGNAVVLNPKSAQLERVVLEEQPKVEIIDPEGLYVRSSRAPEISSVSSIVIKSS